MKFPTHSQLPPAILLMGPTASGKTAAAMALADTLPVELISVDSAQVFRDMNVGTAKPAPEMLQRYPHALIDILSPEERYSAARFCDDALNLMKEITAKGKIPLLVGGTMLYFRALLDGLAELPKANAALRTELDAEAARHGWPAMHAKLMQLDPETAGRLHPTDSQRIQRALEICMLSGQPMSALLAATEKQPPPYRFLSLSLLPSDRSVLHDRIAQRFKEMLDQGLEEEVISLRQRYQLNLDLPSMRCVGYRQTWEMLEGMLPRKELCDRGIFATRQLAKRQITWITNSFESKQFDCLDPRLLPSIQSEVEQFLMTE